MPDVGVASGGRLSAGSWGSSSSRVLSCSYDEVHFSNIVRSYEYLNWHCRGPYVGTVITVQ
jgi:hypothetical protein